DWTGKGFDSPGIYDPRTSSFYLRNTNSTGGADIVSQVTFVTPLGQAVTNPASVGWIPLVGRWTASATHDGVGLFDPVSSIFLLWNDLTPQLKPTPDFAILFGAGLSGYTPVAGKFSLAATTSSIGLWDPQSVRNLTSNSTFLLRDTLGPETVTV